MGGSLQLLLYSIDVLQDPCCTISGLTSLSIPILVSKAVL